MLGARRILASIALALLMVVFLSPLPAMAENKGSGTILLAHPGAMAFSVTETMFFIGNRCGSSPLLQGLDAMVIDLGEATSGRTLKVSTQATGFGSPRVNVAYWSQGCKFIELHGNRYSPYHGVVPSDARWAAISATYGAQITVDWWLD